MPRIQVKLGDKHNNIIAKIMKEKDIPNKEDTILYIIENYRE